VRCAWENTTQGLPKKPITELVGLTVNGAEVSPELVVVAGRAPNSTKDHYHRFHLPELSPGNYRATVQARVLSTGEIVSREVKFAG
jgi:hypothetical protein